MRYHVYVRFHEEFIKVEGDHIMIGLAIKPVKGKANAELIKKLAKHFDVSTANIKIVAGHKSKDKIVEITPNKP
jgi:uncharacterized protein YggU (UPF0235/DUF167 family)